MVSEFMLQQTQVVRVLKKYPEFIQQFPTIVDLANASVRDVLFAWQGLGYNRRALSLHKTAQEIVQQHNGVVPCSVEKLVALPGIGQSTAGAICAFGFNKPVAFIETNISRVYIHFFFASQKQVKDSEIMCVLEQTVDQKNPREWYYALMDYGAMLATTVQNPNTKRTTYHKQSQFEGSDRQIRSHIVKMLLAEPYEYKKLVQKIDAEPARANRIISSLVKDGLVSRNNNTMFITQ